jgi:hypothetical protein
MTDHRDSWRSVRLAGSRAATLVGVQLRSL